ncbi:MAG: DUF4189 domain-containing protein [Neisseria sp.]|nr:DUF4189 domain-containing protein [Neisseria sp.]
MYLEQERLNEWKAQQGSANAIPPYQPTYNYYGALAMDEYGMAYGAWVATGAIAHQFSTKPKAIAECEAAKPFGKCSIVATVSGGALALAWDARNGRSAWATAETMEDAEQNALRTCGSSSCSIVYWITAPRGSVTRGAGTGGHGWLPGNDEALITAMLQRQQVKLYRAQAGLEKFSFTSRSGIYTSPKEAERVAMDACRTVQQGSCRILQTFADTCGVVTYAKVKGKVQYFVATDADAKQAKNKAMQQCADKWGINSCYFYPAVCTGLAYGYSPSLPYEGLTENEKAQAFESASKGLKEWQKTIEAMPTKP